MTILDASDKVIAEETVLYDLTLVELCNTVLWPMIEKYQRQFGGPTEDPQQMEKEVSKDLKIAQHVISNSDYFKDRVELALCNWEDQK